MRGDFLALWEGLRPREGSWASVVLCSPLPAATPAPCPRLRAPLLLPALLSCPLPKSGSRRPSGTVWGAGLEPEAVGSDPALRVLERP